MHLLLVFIFLTPRDISIVRNKEKSVEFDLPNSLECAVNFIKRKNLFQSYISFTYLHLFLYQFLISIDILAPNYTMISFHLHYNNNPVLLSYAWYFLQVLLNSFLTSLIVRHPGAPCAILG